MAYGPRDQANTNVTVREKSKELRFWLNEIDRYERDFKPWEQRSKKIIKRYKDERPNNSKTVQFNILWSNVQTLQPALYAQAPKPNVDRRFQDDDDLSRLVAQVLERSVSYFVQKENFDEVMKQAVQDRLLPGRGTAWIRYCPYIDGEPQITEDVEIGKPMSSGNGNAEPEQAANPVLTGEDVVADYVHWQDFGHTFGRTWQEVRAVWRKVYLDRAQLIARFGPELGKQIPLDSTDQQDKKTDNTLNKAVVYEIWDKSKKEALWVNRAWKDVLDRVDDPLGLEDFFPCPKPIYATIANDNLIPVPDYVQYQDQARELDILTNRIGKICDALRVSGVYDSSAEGVQKLLTEGAENKLLPVENWAIFGEKGGLKGVIDWFPLDMMAQTLSELYEARDRTKQDLYEVTGISDIIRGESNPNETATAQQLKGKFATLRLDSMQKDVARFSRDLVRLMTQVISDHFSLDTIKQLSGVQLMTMQEKQQAQMASQAPPASPGQPPAPPPPVDEKTQELLDLPSWEEVYAVIKNDLSRSYHVDIETDSTIKTDQDEEKQSRVEFLQAAGGFMAQAAQVQDPDLKPLLMELLMFGVRGFKVARDLESEFESTMKKMRKAAENPPPPQPSPEEVAAQMKQQELQQSGQLKQAELQQDAQKTQGDQQLKNKEIDTSTGIELARIHADTKKERIKALAHAHPEVAMTHPDLNEEGQPTPLAQMLQQQAQQTQAVVESLMHGLQQLAQIQAQGNAALIEAVSKPKQVIRDKNGKIAGVQ